MVWRFLTNDGMIRLVKGVLNSYSQVFFSDNTWFAALLVAVTFFNPYAGIIGLIAVLVANLLAFKLGYNRELISKGFYGFNSLLVALGIGVFYEHSLALAAVVLISSVLCLFVSLSLQSIFGKYYLPILSLPFLITTWVVILATRSFDALTINEKGIFVLNELYKIGGQQMVNLYEESISLQLPISVKAYLTSLGAIFFQYNIIAGFIIALGLFFFSRIAFTLSLVGFYSAWLFYQFLGVDMSIFVYNYIGFNYILTAIAIGGYFFIPSAASYAWAVILTPIVALITVSFYNLLPVFQLPILSIPFNIIVLLFIHAIKMRVYPSASLLEVNIQRHSPEENLYTYLVSKSRFRYWYYVPIKLPFWGEWTVLQAHNGEYTHKDEYRHAWDFAITDKNGRQFKNDGYSLTDYYCYNKSVLAPADGVIVEIQDGIADNSLGKVNLINNWGNTIIIKHNEYLYSNISHLKEQSIRVKKGDPVKSGDVLATCGNSGRSPYPHLHFQLQATPFIGSKTIEYPISHFCCKLNGIFNSKNFEIPCKDEVISNIQVNPLLQKAFELTAGQVLKITIRSASIKHAYWEVGINSYNQTFLWEKETNSIAYFVNDGALFRFTHFEGSKKSSLYLGYLTFYEVLMTNYIGVKVESTFPATQIFNPVSILGHDFIAPFISLINAKFLLQYEHDETAVFNPSCIIFKSSVTTYVFRNKKVKYNFETLITEKGIEEIKVITFGYKTV